MRFYGFRITNLLKLIDAVNGVIEGSVSPGKALVLAEEVMRDMGALQDTNSEWYLPAKSDGKS